jgi:protein kinase-like protein
MELLDGRALSEEIEHGGRIALGRAFTLLRMACKGLAATHALGMVHCDVKPHNLVLVQRGGREQLVLVDFGIAQTIGTKPGTVCGTPEYISPEQLDRTELDPRTDVYALGCCAYEMFTGRLLVEETSVERAVSRHLLGIENELVFPPEAKLPECVQALIRSCLARDPERRPASMAALEAAVCEAQIRCGVAPTREDLELPDVDRVRRDGIAIGFADMVGTRSSRRSHAFVGGMLSAAAAIAITVLAMRGDGMTEPRAALATASLGALPGGVAGALISTKTGDVGAPPSAAPVEAPVLDAIATPAPLDDRGTGAVDARSRPRKSAAGGGVVPPDYRKARQLAAKEVREHPRSAAARVRLGDALRGLGWSGLAARQYREGAKLGSSTAKRKLRAVEAG